MSSNRTIAAVVLTTVALSVGTVGVASASQSKSNAKAVSVRQTTTRTTVNAVANPMAGPMGQKGNQGAELANVLITLVRAGTITQSQSDAITAALNTARLAHEAHEANEANEDADHSPINANRAARDAIIATAIGKTPAAIKAELATGKSLGVIAGDKRAALITALVADQTKRIDAAVTAGKMTSAQATTLKAGLTAQVTAEVDALRPAMGPEMGKGGKMGRHGGKN